MEAPEPFVTVAQIPASVNSRSGPVCEEGNGALQPVQPGKYCYSSPDSSSDCPSTCRSLHHHCLDAYDVRSTEVPDHLSIEFPERINLSTMEAPEPFVTVAQIPASVNSRSGPVCEGGNGALQPVQSGKYPVLISDALSDCPSPSRIRLTGQHIFDAANPADGLRMYYQNVRGLKSKIIECFVSTSEFCYDIYAFTETWLDSSVPSSQLFCSDYTVFRCDRNRSNSSRSRGGGVLIAVSCLDGMSSTFLRRLLPVLQTHVR
ncbi:uncharacterized protein LOC129750788 [Uranotaenia lowii]|uniref:uncharacterized protein LOC129750788 n=1 Tax=Uranotaenia lowii TaxID=190385 RepID=UPI002478F71B|nr:uncharacterized protein LOC129750788 [Uranotaenia lowii]